MQPSNSITRPRAVVFHRRHEEPVARLLIEVAARTDVPVGIRTRAALLVAAPRSFGPASRELLSITERMDAAVDLSGVSVRSAARAIAHSEQWPGLSVRRVILVYWLHRIAARLVRGGGHYV